MIDYAVLVGFQIHREYSHPNALIPPASIIQDLLKPLSPGILLIVLNRRQNLFGDFPDDSPAFRLAQNPLRADEVLQDDVLLLGVGQARDYELLALGLALCPEEAHHSHEMLEMKT